MQAIELNDYSLSRGRFIRRIFIFQLAIIILNLDNLCKFQQMERHALGKCKQNRSRVTFYGRKCFILMLENSSQWTNENLRSLTSSTRQKATQIRNCHPLEATTTIRPSLRPGRAPRVHINL